MRLQLLLYCILISLVFGCKGSPSSQSSLTITKEKIYIAAHRGGYENEYKDKAPENSIANIQNAINQGFEIYESDIRRTLDGIFIIMHDATIDRTTNGIGEVKNLLGEDVKKYRLTYYNGEETNESIPFFEDFISKGNREIIFKFDFKSNLVYLKELIEEIQALKLQNSVILRLRYNERIVKELENYDLNKIPHILFRVNTLSEFQELKRTFKPEMISILTKENFFTQEHLQIIEAAANDNILIEAHTFNDYKDEREEFWEEQIKLPITIFHTKKPILFQEFLKKKNLR
ncbi:glycerophosphodiester phosphodiesterase family protein [Bacteroidota bacterium]